MVVNTGSLGSRVTMLSKLDWWRLYHNQLVPFLKYQKMTQTCHCPHLASGKGCVNVVPLQRSCNIWGRGQDGGYNRYKWNDLWNRWDRTYHAICIHNVEIPPVKKHTFLLIEGSFLKLIVSLSSWSRVQWPTGRHCTSGHLGSCHYTDSHIVFHS